MAMSPKPISGYYSEPCQLSVVGSGLRVALEWLEKLRLDSMVTLPSAVTYKAQRTQPTTSSGRHED